MRHYTRTLSSSRRNNTCLFHSFSVVHTLKSVQKAFEDGNKHAHIKDTGQINDKSKRLEEVRLPSSSKMTQKKVKRNQVGVQLLSQELHSQIFRNVHIPPPQATYVRIAREHLRTHGLDPHQASTVPDTSFVLPPLQGATIDEHFYRIGMTAAQPWLSIAQRFSNIRALPKPEHWHIQSGWTRYHYNADGSSYSESVLAPEEEMLSFDVETLPKYSPYAVIACAMSEKHWYSWISPWLLGETDDPQHLISLGDPNQHRIVIGHNVSYDRARIHEEYNLIGNQTRFLDTMSLHVAVKGISSHQRPAWMKYRKSKKEEQERKEEALEATLELIRQTEEQHGVELDSEKKADLNMFRQSLEDGLPQLRTDVETEATTAAKRWEDITSANSLVDVAKLHCDIKISKDTRDDFLTHSPAQILENITEYLSYCAGDVEITHAVYSKTFPAFIAACPSPVSLAGILTMGSSFLTVNNEWELYLQRAEGKYRELEEKIKNRLASLAEEARDMVVDNSWQNDVWLSQLDWTPKVAGASRGVEGPPRKTSKTKKVTLDLPTWLHELRKNGPFHSKMKNSILPLILRCKYDGYPMKFSTVNGWLYDKGDGELTSIGDGTKEKLRTIFGKRFALKHFRDGRLTFDYPELTLRVIEGEDSDDLSESIMRIAEDIHKEGGENTEDPWLSQLNWDLAIVKESPPDELPVDTSASDSNIDSPEYTPVIWPKWYWDLAKPKKDMPPGAVDITVRNRLAPLLLRLKWRDWPLVYSREHGWTYRVSPDAHFETRQKPLQFFVPADASLQESTLQNGYKFYKMPHKDGEEANVGSPLGKTFMKYSLDGTLTSPGNEANDALEMNAQCSYWISSRDRIRNQMVVWERQGYPQGFSNPDQNQKWGIILPQVVTMGTVTRRAIEKTWLTASNAKPNRVGSELKAMIRAPDGYVIMGADVDSEELWISSAMGDAQFGFHGATALGWMTLEGTKSSGTDLHSKTANILGISRDQAKVFNYSRIYGAGVRHAVLLLQQSNPSILVETAQKQAEKLYASTKGKNTHRMDMFGRRIWFGGTESFVFNKLEEIALSDRPQTPALSCGVTYALSKEYLTPGFGTDYMTSRINWVVQSSGVDYLHLLIVSMQYLISKYEIKARYLISVHDELRYLVKEEDKYRAALALQIANLWTRSLFAYRLGMDDLPQSIAFFSTVDIDKVLRKEVNLPCVTPSQPVPIEPGEALDIAGVLEKTNGGSLWADGRPMSRHERSPVGSLDNYVPPNYMAHRASSARFLQAQATSDFAEVKKMAEMEHGQYFQGGIGGPRTGRGRSGDFDFDVYANDPTIAAAHVAE